MEVSWKRYHCKKCGHSWDFVEKTPGDVPDRCGNQECLNPNFDGAYKARGRDGNQRNWTTNVWEGALLGNSREWDF